MNITLPPEVERALTSAAEKRGISAEAIVLEVVQEHFETLDHQLSDDEWLALLKSVGSPAGVSLTDEQVSREYMYD